MSHLLIATRNPGKFKEIKVILGDVPYNIVSVDDLKLVGDVVEDGKTYEENAFKKARFFSSQADGVLTLSDDSGLEVEALKGELGLKTRRWGAGESASDEEWLEHFLNVMEGKEDRRAKFVCYAVLVVSSQRSVVSSDGRFLDLGDGLIGKSFYAEVPGIITREPQAPLLPGLPLSSCFMPDGSDKVYAALSSEEKGKLSHRGWAVQKARSFLVE